MTHTDIIGPGVLYRRPAKCPMHQYIEMIVSHIYSPDDFYVQLLTLENTGNALEELNDRIK